MRARKTSSRLKEQQLAQTAKRGHPLSGSRKKRSSKQTLRNHSWLLQPCRSNATKQARQSTSVLVPASHDRCTLTCQCHSLSRGRASRLQTGLCLSQALYSTIEPRSKTFMRTHTVALQTRGKQTGSMTVEYSVTQNTNISTPAQTI